MMPSFASVNTVDSGGFVCLNRISAAISRASVEFRLPRGGAAS
jgi:hypothetical protein